MKTKFYILLVAAIITTACGNAKNSETIPQITETEAIITEKSSLPETEQTSSVTEEITVTAEAVSLEERATETTAETEDVTETESVETTTSTSEETTTVSAETTTVISTTALPSETAATETTTLGTTTTAATTTVANTTTVTTTAAPEITTQASTAKEEDKGDYTVIEIEGKKYNLTFEDEFEGKVLNANKWEKCPEWSRQDLNNQWDNDMSYLDGDGNLIIEMSYDESIDRYLSGGVRSKRKFEQAYGYFEIRCTVNTVPGYWTAFWLMGESVADETEGGVNGTEIDIMESAYYNEKMIQNTLNWDGYGAAHKVSGYKAPADVYDGEYHTFSLLWTEDEYVYYIDGAESWRTKAEEALGVCEVPLYIKITSEMGSWTASQGLSPENLPDYMIVDYVRVYAQS